MAGADATNSQPRDVSVTTWRGPAVMLFARAFFAVVAQAVVAVVFALQSSPTPWRDAAPWLPVYGTLRPPYLYEALPLPAALYGVLLWPFIWGFTEQMTYNGYLAPRFQVLCRSTAPAVAIVAFAWSFQHVVMPLLFDAKFMAFRLLSAVPNTVFQAALYLRLRRLIPFAIAHSLMDGAGVLVGVLLPLLRA